MKTTEILSIEIPVRQRKVIVKEKVRELADSIHSKGLLHPIVLIENVDRFKLVAGERRLRAIKLLNLEQKIFSCDGALVPPNHVPYVLVTDLTEIQLREAELEENVIRVDLTWQERVAALDELHELRKAQNPKQSRMATAREIVGRTAEDATPGQETAASQRIARAQMIAPFLDDPEVSRAKNEKHAHRIVQTKLEQDFEEILASRRKNISLHKLIKGDLCELLAAAEGHEAYSLIIADPPYGVGADKFGDAASKVHKYFDDPQVAWNIYQTIFELGWKVTVPDAHMYLFCDIDLFTRLRNLGKSLGWKVWRTPLVWYKPSPRAHAPELEWGFRHSYEFILFATKGKRPFRQVYSDVLEIPPPFVKEVAAQKPVELYRTLISRSCSVGEAVLDPCCGSGTIFPAAQLTNTIATGYELSDETYAIAHKTLISVGGQEDTSDE